MTFDELTRYMRTHYDGAEFIRWFGSIYVFENRHQRFFVAYQYGCGWQVYTYHETIGKKESGQ